MSPLSKDTHHRETNDALLSTFIVTMNFSDCSQIYLPLAQVNV